MREDDQIRLRHMLDAAREAVHFDSPIDPYSGKEYNAGRTPVASHIIIEPRADPTPFSGLIAHTRSV